MRDIWRKEALADVVNLALGAWLFLTPWILGFTSESAASWNAWVCGLAIGALAIAAITAFTEWEEWINLALGIWVVIAPWLVAFSGNSTATRVHLVVGVIVAIVAGVRLWLVYRSPPRVRA
jgi:SPW repeat